MSDVFESVIDVGSGFILAICINLLVSPYLVYTLVYLIVWVSH